MLRHVVLPRKLWLPSLFGRLTLALFVLSLLTLYLYVVGNLQGFADETLFVLFNIESTILSLCAIIGFVAFLVYVFTLPFRRKWKLDRILFSGAASVFSLVLYFGVSLLRAFMAPYGGL